MENHDQKTPPAAKDALAALWKLSGERDAALECVRLTGQEPALPSSFAVGTAAQASIAVSALAAAELHGLRGGMPQQIDVDMRHAAIEFRAEQYLRVDGAPAPEFRDKLTRTFQSRDTFGFEQEAAAAGMVVTAMRSFDEWDAHPQGQAVAGLPLLSIERLGDAPPRPLPPAARPLSGVRVLDLTRVIAGPVCGRTLAGHGADVLLVSAPHLPSIEPLVMETGLGKRACWLDLRTLRDKQAFEALLGEADVLVQGYRPGALDALGLGPEAAARRRPGLVYVSLCAYGEAGPWAARRGFDSLVQTASGFNHAEAQAGGATEPAPLPAQALDRATGYLMAYAVMAALMRRSREGGSWHVRLSLAQTGQWLRHLGRVAGGLKIVYDLALWRAFRSRRAPEDPPAGPGAPL